MAFDPPNTGGWVDGRYFRRCLSHFYAHETNLNEDSGETIQYFRGQGAIINLKPPDRSHFTSCFEWDR